MVEKLNAKKDLIEGSSTNLPVAGQGEAMSELVGTIIDPKNCRQFAHLKSDSERHMLAIGDAYAMARDEFDVDGFYRNLFENMFVLSATVPNRREGVGIRSEEVQNIGVGQLNRAFALDLAEIKSGGSNRELKDVV